MAGMVRTGNTILYTPKEGPCSLLLLHLFYRTMRARDWPCEGREVRLHLDNVVQGTFRQPVERDMNRWMWGVSFLHGEVLGCCRKCCPSCWRRGPPISIPCSSLLGNAEKAATVFHWRILFGSCQGNVIIRSRSLSSFYNLWNSFFGY